MTMRLPNLDDIRWEQLNQEARSLIPAYAPDWTNFNASDPGITLLELLAYFTETLIYRANRIGDEHRLRYLQLLNGPKTQETLDEEWRVALRALSTPARAVTAEDFEVLARTVTLPRPAGSKGSRAGDVARAKCLPNRNLERGDAALDRLAAPGEMTVLIVARDGGQPHQALLRAVKEKLHEARLITTRVHVVPATYVGFRVRLTLIKKSRVSSDSLRSDAVDRLREYFDPLRGGPAKKGWPFGKDVCVSELYALLSDLPGLDYATRSLGRDGVDLEQLVPDPAYEDRRRLNQANELECLEIHDEELLAFHWEPQDISVEETGRRP